MDITNLLKAKKLFNEGEIQKAGKAIADFYTDTYSNWTEKRTFPPEAELQEAGIENVAALLEFEKEIAVKSLNLNLIDAQKLSSDGKTEESLSLLSRSIWDAYRIGLDIRSDANNIEIPNNIPEIYANTDFKTSEDVLSFKDQLRDTIIVEHLEGFIQATDKGDFKQAHEIGKTPSIASAISLSQPLTADLVKDRFIPPSAIDAYAAKENIDSASVRTALNETYLFTTFKRLLESTQTPGIEKLKIINQSLKNCGLSSYDDVSETLKSAMDEISNGDYAKELNRLAIVSDLTKVVRGYDITDSPMLKSPSRLIDFSNAAGKSSIFASSAKDVLNPMNQYGYDDMKTMTRGYKTLMRLYHDHLTTLDSPEYPTEKVASDYFNAAARDGANISFSKISDRIAVAGYSVAYHTLSAAGIQIPAAKTHEMV